MNRLIFRLVCWLLALSLSGLPLYSLSADLSIQTGKDDCRHAASHVPQNDTDANINGRMNVVSDSETTASQCCCEEPCQCVSLFGCHHQSHRLLTLLPQSLLPAITPTPAETAGVVPDLYHSRSVLPEIHPPIV